MALTVEDGTGLSGAESYISVTDADAYHAKRLNVEWANLDNATKEALLIKATEYLDAKYGDRWQGSRKEATQALSWPREKVVVDGADIDSDSVPVAIERACAELALKSHEVSELAPDLGQKVTREKVDVIEVEYDPNSPQQVIYQKVELMISAYLVSSYAPVRFERA